MLQSLPELDEFPSTPEEKLQAFRVVIMHELFKRGSKANLHDLGQEAKIVEMRKELLGGRPLLQFVKIFDENFFIEDLGHGAFRIELLSLDVTDTSAVEAWAAQQRAGGKFAGQVSEQGKGKAGLYVADQGKCKGKGKGKAAPVPSAAPSLQWPAAQAAARSTAFEGSGWPSGPSSGASGAGGAGGDDWWDWWNPMAMMQMMFAMKGKGPAGKGACGWGPGAGGKDAWQPSLGAAAAGAGKGCGWKGAAAGRPKGRPSFAPS